CECSGCDAADHDQCVSEVEEATREVANEGCDVQLDKYVTCLADAFTCKGAVTRWPSCGTQAKALSHCTTSAKSYELPVQGIACRTACGPAPPANILGKADSSRDGCIASCNRFYGDGHESSSSSGAGGAIF